MKKIFALAALAFWALPGWGEVPVVAEGYQPIIRVTPLLRTSVTVADQPIAYPRTDAPEVTAVRVEIPPGAETGWHKHPFPCYGYILAGELVVEMEGGKSVSLKAGDALVESVGVRHNGRNVGDKPVRLVMFVTGEKGLPFTVKIAPPQ